MAAGTESLNEQGVSDRSRSLSPLDGRYLEQTGALGDRLSEWALMRMRLHVEVEWLIWLSRLAEVPELRPLEPDEVALLRGLVERFDDDAAGSIRAFERQANHDVKAVEYHLRAELGASSLDDVLEFVHFACTSEDVNNLAYGLMLKAALELEWLPAARGLVAAVEELARATRELALLSLTHGQPATPTTFGKEMAVFALRWRRALARVEAVELHGKLNGAVGTYGAHVAAYPDVDWEGVSRGFVESLGLAWNPLTTQIEPHDSIAELLHAVARFGAILVDFDRDMWLYVSRGCLRQRAVAGEVGSSTMPHKVNPINFENSEANAGLSGAIAGHMATTLAASRLQRDLSDSSLIRNLGVVFGHSLVAIAAAGRGLGRVEVDAAACAAELAERWELLAEPIQTVLRKHGRADPYGQLKALTRGTAVSRDTLVELILALDLPDEDRERLLALRPDTYVGLASRLVDHLDEP